MFMHSLFIWVNLGNSPLIGLLNNSVAGLCNPAPMAIDLLYNKARFTSLLFLIMCFTNCMYDSSWPLLY